MQDSKVKAMQQFTSEPDPKREKFFATFPFPYMNGRLHLGHGFTMMKADAQVKFRQLQGVNTLFPFAFHCTGIPIKAACDTLREEIAKGISEKTPRRIAPETPYQFHILLDMNIPAEDIPQFTNYEKWFNYFPNCGMEDLQRMALSVDWRRSFITTDSNPYYDRFVKWYIERLKDLGYCKYGYQAVVWSPKDQQACSDHARSKGEGVRPTKKTLAKFQLYDPVMGVLDRKLHLVSLIDCPEKCKRISELQINSQEDFGIYELKNDEHVVCNDETALRLAYQGHTKEFGKVHKVMEISPVRLIMYSARSLSDPEVIIPIRSDNVLPFEKNKGTGVMCVLNDHVKDFFSPEEVELCRMQGKYIDYYLLDSPVISRSGDQCLVAFTPQWFMDYGNEEWKSQVREHINQMNSSEEVKSSLLDTVDWLHEKSFGRDANRCIGTTTPWDESVVIDSLSDSTVYMMYYTIAHYLHKDIYGQESSEISLETWEDDSVLDYIFTDSPFPESLNTDTSDTLNKMQKEFRYWYPLDLRVSGKDLLNNHLPFCLFHHVALCGTKGSPIDFRTNGYILVNGEKMSKSKGNRFSAVPLWKIILLSN